jgi:hypothetical protein
VSATTGQLATHQVHHADTAVLDTPLPVRLHLWGFTPTDLRMAQAWAKSAADRSHWDITQIVEATGTPSPIPTRDLTALAQHSDYEWQWAAYRIPGKESQACSEDH